MDAATDTAKAPSAPAAQPFLKLSKLSKTYTSSNQEVVALNAVDFEVKQGEFVVFFGPSGCGKSSLLNMIAGFEEPSEGSIMLEGNPVTQPGPDRLMMFQEHALFPWLTVLDNVLYGLRRQRQFRFKRRQRLQRARELLEMVHLGDFERASIHELSGGMKQRAALARALAPNPKLLLIDEPFPQLDALVRAKIYTELQEILIRTHKTILSVTHDPNEAACLGDRVVVFTGRPGRIKAEIKVDLPRPRDINDPKITEYGARIMAELEEAAKK
jgi:NitT/TauT family transport system ATP-binding protein